MECGGTVQSGANMGLYTYSITQYLLEFLPPTCYSIFALNVRTLSYTLQINTDYSEQLLGGRIGNNSDPGLNNRSTLALVLMVHLMVLIS